MNTYDIVSNKDLNVRSDINKFLNSIDESITIVCATKYANSNSIKKLLNYGLNNFGENRVDSFLEKYEKLKDESITWHFIGHLQTNKAVPSNL